MAQDVQGADVGADVQGPAGVRETQGAGGAADVREKLKQGVRGVGGGSGMRGQAGVRETQSVQEEHETRGAQGVRDERKVQVFQDKGEYSFSTCWNIKRHATGSGMIEEIRALGFRYVELNYNVTRELLATIEPMIERGQISVSSVHNVFPFIADKDYDTDSVMLGFDDEEKRKRAVELLVGSMEYAHRYGAKAVVVHPGEVPFEINIDAELKQLYKTYGKESPEYRQLWERMLERRERLSPRYAQRIRNSLEEACDVAARKGWNVAVGIETRSRCYQMPTLREAKAICDGLAGGQVYLWYDIGHAMMMDRMGLYDNLRELEEVRSYVYGLHIHETLGLSDHWCPYVHSREQAEPDYFDHFLELVRDAPLKVYELKAACEPHEIELSHTMIQQRLAALKR